MLRSHGMVREADSDALRLAWERRRPDLNPKFIFAYPTCNYRSTEVNAVIGRSQLKRLDANNRKRVRNFRTFLDGLDPAKYRTDFAVEGSVNYAFVLILREPDDRLRDAVERTLDANGVEYRRGASGGGNQMRQPYLRGVVPRGSWKHFPQVEHVHFYGYYIGNYPTLDPARIRWLCRLLNDVSGNTIRATC
jgi:CDP-6-deoxy-D-xylo-4-hexulose-3-dehydrase